jgi:parvulin-like peptidyl-prolyl isomerase
MDTLQFATLTMREYVLSVIMSSQYRYTKGAPVQRLAIYLLLVGALLLAACGTTTAASPTNENVVSNPTNVEVENLVVEQVQPTELATPVPAALPANEQGVSVVATVNGTDISLADFQRTLARYEQQQPNFADAATLQSSVLETMIEQVLIDQAAAEQQIMVTDEELDTEIQSNVALAGSEEAWQAWLAENQYSPEEFRETLRDSLITNRVLDSITQDLHNPVPHVHARHILVASETEAADILNRLNNGEDFATLASQYSLDETTARQGGDLGWFTEDQLLEPSLARVAFSLQPNMVAGPIQTMLGYHILQTLEREDRAIPDEQMPEAMQARFENWVNSLVAAATIERYL